jgi:hypothetical protein
MSCVRISRRHDYDAVTYVAILKSLYQRPLLDGSQCDQLKREAAAPSLEAPFAGRGPGLPCCGNLNRREHKPCP